MSEQVSWWLAAQRASYSEFYGYARGEFPRMRETKGSALVDAIQAATMATRNLGKKKQGGRFSGVTTSWGL